jgi:hypothetical protein
MWFIFNYLSDTQCAYFEGHISDTLPGDDVRHCNEGGLVLLIQSFLAWNLLLDIIANYNTDRNRLFLIAGFGEWNLHHHEPAIDITPFRVSQRKEQIEGLVLVESLGDGLTVARFFISPADDFLPIFEGVMLAIITLFVSPEGTA